MLWLIFALSSFSILICCFLFGFHLFSNNSVYFTFDTIFFTGFLYLSHYELVMSTFHIFNFIFFYKNNDINIKNNNLHLIFKKHYISALKLY